MAEVTRRAFAAGILAVGVTPLAARADDVDEGEFEFDGKAGKNPAGNATGFKVTGTVRVPKGCKIEEVVVRFQASTDPNKSRYRTLTATVDVTKTPATWEAEVKDLPVGEYWVQGNLRYSLPGGQIMVADSPDKRRVFVRPPKK
jgi:hypothetical protein